MSNLKITEAGRKRTRTEGFFTVLRDIARKSWAQGRSIDFGIQAVKCYIAIGLTDAFELGIDFTEAELLEFIKDNQREVDDIYSIGFAQYMAERGRRAN